MNHLQVFKHPDFGEVRTMEVDGVTYFVGRDVAAALGYNNTKDAILLHVDECDKHIIQRSETSTFEIPNRGLTVINESGVYSLIFQSRLPTAQKFKHWVTNEVLPALRKQGFYAVEEVMKNPDMLIEALNRFKKEQEKSKALTQLVAVKNQQILEMKPKASYYDIVLQCKDLVPISIIAKDFGWSGVRLNRYLHKKGIQYKQSGKIWLLYQEYAKKGYTQSKTSTFYDKKGNPHFNLNTQWTQQGRLFIYELMKGDGYLPIVEQENFDD